ncbi:ATP phosphoribosyltransferase regulatory subunit [Rhodoferax sp.]|uniref:ATP phosphoribosyltransferase regulatory subunit n=1 Tax=Rhodoferax sp. TaxID=50421 RepID=UPI0027310F73|nr:ATP phosphoribosyltransferase regulatory subunit [Rhodoferax sp.]MDP1530987.1 ATP phosphoribosyltransferase regulatory subunit [Rhodoferax sp.]MDP1942547.1 ATP phosphoribosyltransferase regulatory subunit [Rhodoferax sp.]MDP2440318.1 ATP phosphoribosyltransferase regulatory subunit [Rhodoferax sp.]MDP3193262.1 ATP phosphoribosyltransferase regulatory subunit [Rhodoferax sp.]MDP3338103.1 ATP phosphoribosyltransferase regulatory subunit [Rhodoferax sp.]
MSAWVLPDHIADVLPSEARHIEELRRDLLDTARSYGYELVMPPLLEHLESLLTGAGSALDLQTFKLVDQLSGRMMGLRADSTPQVARIDAHLLNRAGVTRLCYCGPVLHTRASAPHATREPLQLGAEIYGHAGLEADIEILTLAFDCLQAARVQAPSIDLADARLVKALLADVSLSPARLSDVHAALAAKDSAELAALTRDLPQAVHQGLLALVQLYGDAGVLAEAEKTLPALPAVREALQSLRYLAQHLPAAQLSFDLADLRGYAYYTGVRFAIYAPGASDALVRGGRYDEVGAVFGRNRPAAGFSLDLKALVAVVTPRALQAAIRAPWREDAGLNAAIAALRARGEVVVCVLPGHESEVDEFHCDRELIEVGGQWVVQAMH